MANGKTFSFMGAVLAAVLLAGCGAAMKAPLPAAPVTQAERDRFEGAWIGGKNDGVFEVRFRCDGVGELAITAWDGEKFHMVHGEAVLSRGKQGGQFLSIREEMEPGRWSDYIPVKYRFVSPSSLVVWLPRTPPFADAVSAGKLRGKSDKFETLLTSPPEAVLAFIDAPDDTVLFDYSDPLTFRRIAPAEGDAWQARCAKK